MSNINVKHFLDDNDFEYRSSSDQYNLKKCPLCGDDRFKFYINSKNGLWDCKICNETGNFYQLKGKLGQLDNIGSSNELFKNKIPLDEKMLDKYIDNLKNNKDALDYLKNKRKFTDETIEKFKIGLTGDWIVIPHFQNNQLWNLKMRNYKEKEFKRVQGQPSVLFNADNIDISKQALVIVESETDCIAASQMGITNVVGLTVGASSFPPEWLKYTLPFKEIYVCLNTDSAGERGAKKIAEKIGLGKCKKVELPTNDVNDYLIEKGKEGFYDLIKNSKSFSLSNIKNISEYVDELDDWLNEDGSLSGLELPFFSLNSYLQGFKGEDLIILSGDTGQGKTTFCLNLMYHFIKNNKKCLGFFLEGKILYYILRMMSIESSIKTNDLKNSDKLEDLKKNFADYPLYFYSGAQSELDSKKIMELLPVAVNLFDIDFVVIDNLQKFIREERDVVQQTSRAVSILKDLAVDLKIPILLISHIRKPEKGRQRISMHDAKSSSTIYQDADVYLSVWNNRGDKDNEDDIKLSINKNRMGEGGIDINMIFNKELSQFRERVNEIDYTKKGSIDSIIIED
jgi:archaellum biogenesis ATPase FlaH